MTLSILSSCGLKPEEEETTTETTTAAPEFDRWSEAYEEYLLSLIAGQQKLLSYELEAEECRFDIIDINGNGIPELFISEGEYQASVVDIFIYNGYEVKLAGSAGVNGEINYSTADSTICTYELIEDGENYQETNTSYLFTGEEVVKQWQGVTVTADETLVPVDCTQDYGEAVSFYAGEDGLAPESYAELYATYIPAVTETFGRDAYALTQDNIIAVLEKGEDPADIQETTEAQAGQYTFELDLSNSVKAAYKAVLEQSLKDENYQAGAVFSFGYVNDDDVPELLVSVSTAHAGKVNFYTEKNGEAVLLCSAGQYGVAGYMEKQGVIIDEYNAAGALYTTVYSVESGKSETVWEASKYVDGTYYDDEATEDDGSVVYMIANEEATGEDYQAAYTQYVNDDTVYNIESPASPETAFGYTLNQETIDLVFGTAA